MYQKKFNSEVCAHGVMVKVLYCGIIASEFKLQLYDYVHFQINILGKDMNYLISLRYGLNSITTVLLGGVLMV